MKKILTIIALALVSSVTFAAGHFGAGAISGTAATSGAIAGGASLGNGSGQSNQATVSGASNTTLVGAFSDNTNGIHTVKMGASFGSSGNSYSYSAGTTNVAGGAVAAGATFGLSAQGGFGNGYAAGGASDIAADADSLGFGVGVGAVAVEGAQLSASGSAVANNGLATDDAYGYSAAVGVANIDVDAQPHNVVIVESSDTLSAAGGGSVSTVSGTALAGGIGGGVADADAFTISGQGVIALP